MKPRELVHYLRARGIDFELSPDLRRFRPRPAVDEDTFRTLRRERLWILMLVVHEAGGDVYDPRLAFLASAESGLTHGAVRHRMQIAFDIDAELADALIELAESAGYLRRNGELLTSVGDVAAALTRQREFLPA